MKIIPVKPSLKGWIFENFHARMILEMLPNIE